MKLYSVLNFISQCVSDLQIKPRENGIRSLFTAVICIELTLLFLLTHVFYYCASSTTVGLFGIYFVIIMKLVYIFRPIYMYYFS